MGKEHRPDCDETARALLTLQLDTASGASRIADRVLIIAFAAFLAVFSLLFWILPDRAVSETENKALTQFPKCTVQTLLSGDFMEDFASYMADQFPARDFFVQLKGFAERAQGRMENNGVILGADDTLVVRDETTDSDNLRTNLHALASFSEQCAALGIPASCAVAGRTMDVLDGVLPSFYGSYYSDRLWDALADAAAAEGVTILNLRDPLRARAEAGEYVAYRTDHHWTTLGAYYGTAEILASWGDDVRPLTGYRRESVSRAFYGTTWSTAGTPGITPDEMEYFRFDGDEAFVTEIVGGASFSGFYDTSYLEKKDKYSSFLGGNNGLVTVRKNGESRPTLLIVKDSFAHSAAPFLAEQYDLILLDTRYYRRVPARLLDEYHIDRVLFLLNIDSLTASDSLKLLEAGLDGTP